MKQIRCEVRAAVGGIVKHRMGSMSNKDGKRELYDLLSLLLRSKHERD